MKSRFNILLFVFCLFACRENSGKSVRCIQNAFYYWKSDDGALSIDELTQLKTLQTQKLYVKFFEVGKDDIYGSVPIAKSHLHIEDYTNQYLWQKDSNLCKAMKRMEIVPTVFIKNEILYSASAQGLDSLADNINFLIKRYYDFHMNRPFVTYKEIQIDCDWTAKTKDNYFYLLKSLKRISHKTLSCTLRLYPYKYPNIMGVPPVDKATLMCYNLLNPLKSEDQNSILDNEELEKYLKNVKKYPLHLDIALPVFSWMQVYKENVCVGILNMNEVDVKTELKFIKPLWYEMKNDKEVGDLYLREGDKIKLEEVTEKTISKTISLIKANVHLDDTTTVTLFHLDGANLKNYNDETLNGFYSAFAQ